MYEKRRYLFIVKSTITIFGIYRDYTFVYFYIFKIKRTLLDLNFENKIEPKAGLLLVSEPFLDSDYFTRSVILICDHNDKGSFGFVLNNFLEEKFDGLPEPILSSDTRISIGGPVEVSNLYFIHTFGDKVPGSTKLADGIHLGGDFDSLKDNLEKSKNPDQDVRYFLGYSGWDENQLKNEIKEKSWVVCTPASKNWIMDTKKTNLWESCLKSLGGKYEMFSKFPVNPNNN